LLSCKIVYGEELMVNLSWMSRQKYAPFLRRSLLFLIFGLILFIFLSLRVGGVKAQATINFGNQTIGTTSGVQTYTLTNPFFPSGSLDITGISVTGDFAIAGGTSCTIGTFSGASCDVAMTFTPTALGTRSGTLTIITGAGSAVVPLVGTGVSGGSPVSTVGLPTVPVPPTANPLISQTVPVIPGSIAGFVYLDGKATPGFKVRIDPLNVTTLTDFGGRYYFGDLTPGTYIIRVFDYAGFGATPVNGRDFSNQTIARGEQEERIDFQFTSKNSAQPANPTPTPTLQTPTEVPLPTATPSNGGGGAVTPQCPGAGNSNFQISMRGTPVNENASFICIRVSAGTNLSSTVDLNNTITVRVPASVNRVIANGGSAGVNGNTVTWRAGVLSPGDSATLVIGIDEGIGALGSVSTQVSGKFSTGEGFNRTLPGLVPLVEVIPNAPVVTPVPPTPARPVARPPVNQPQQPVRVPNTGEPAAPQAGYSLDFGLTVAISLLWVGLALFILWKVVNLTFRSSKK
jgi:hypothetical protein